MNEDGEEFFERVCTIVGLLGFLIWFAVAAFLSPKGGNP